MSRVAKAPVTLPAGVEVKISDAQITVKGKQGSIDLDIHSTVEIKQEDNVLTFAPKGGDKKANAMAGTFRSLVNNMVTGVVQGYEKKLILQGVGYRAKLLVRP